MDRDTKVLISKKIYKQLKKDGCTYSDIWIICGLICVYLGRDDKELEL